MNGDLFEIMVAIGIILVGLLGGRKKKPVPKGGRRPAPQRPPRPADRPFDVEDIERIILGRGPVEPERVPIPPPEPDPTPPHEETAWEAGVDRGSTSVETLDRAGGASHERFHHLYMERPAQPTPVPIRPVLSPDALRRAIIWREILGPPKGLRE